MEDSFVNTKIVRNKVRAMLNMSKTYSKNILLMTDLNLPFLKENNFFEIIQSAIEKNRNFFYFSFFDQTLYIHRNRDKNEIGIGDNTSDNKEKYQFGRNSYDNMEVKNLFKTKSRESGNQSRDDEEEEDYNNFEEFRSFIENYEKVENIFTKNLKQRVDNAIKTVLKFHQFKEYPKNNNFLIVLTSIHAGFSFQRDNLIEISKILYESQYSLMVCIIDDENLFINEKLKMKLDCYKKFIEGNIINGHLFILKNFSFLKYIINCVVPNRYKEFDPFTMKTFLEISNCSLNSEKTRPVYEKINSFKSGISTDILI